MHYQNFSTDSALKTIAIASATTTMMAMKVDVFFVQELSNRRRPLIYRVEESSFIHALMCFVK